MGNKGRILIVEDERELSEVMSLYLRKSDYFVDVALDGLQGENKIENSRYDLIILDIMMPGKDGWSLLRKIKANYSETKVILTTARGEEEDRIFGLELGADDYLVKPLSMRELLLRVNLRIKTELIKSENELFLRGLRLNQKSRTLYEDDIEINLTPKEYDLFMFFFKNQNQVFNREQLLNQVWGYDFMGDTRTVDTHIKKLREKINFCRKHLKTVWGVGYKLDEK